jgi:magnesium transporter
MQVQLTTPDGVSSTITDLTQLTSPYWVDIDATTLDVSALDALLTGTFGVHPLAVESALAANQRPRIDEYDQMGHVVAIGMADDGSDLFEVHLFVSDHGLVTLHRGTNGVFDRVRGRLAAHHANTAAPAPIVMTFHVLDGLIDSYFPSLSSLDDQIDELEANILKDPNEEQLGVLFGLKRQIIAIRKAVNPQRDMIAALSSDVVSLPGMTDAGLTYFRSLYDHLIRINDLADSYRDLITGALDTHLAMVSNRLNVVMKQLAIISTLFLPLGFLTGFFGQNFTWPINHWYASGPDFWFIGIGLEVVAVILVFLLFKKRGWLRAGPVA